MEAFSSIGWPPCTGARGHYEPVPTPDLSRPTSLVVRVRWRRAQPSSGPWDATS